MEAEEAECTSDQMMDRYQSPEISIPRITRWPTGQQHKPADPVNRFNSLEFQNTGNFDHDSLIHNPAHTICSTVVGACGEG